MFVAREAQLKVHNKKLVYLKPLTKLPPFEVWIPIVLVETIANPKKVSEEVMLINILPLFYTIEYHSMYALGNHLWVVNVNGIFLFKIWGYQPCLNKKPLTFR